MSKFQIYVDIKYTFETALPKLQYLDMTAVFMPVESKYALKRTKKNGNNLCITILFFSFEFAVKSM